MHKPDYQFDPSWENTIRQRLEVFSPIKQSTDPVLRRAAVAIVITQDQTGAASVPVTLRPTTLKRHSGQYALPGGRLDDDETVEVAALRELHEELGIQLPQSAILGRLDDYPTRSGFLIGPIVVWGGKSLRITPDPGEVALVHLLPFIELNSPEIPILSASKDKNRQVLSAYFPTLGHTIFAPTAAILYQFREIVLRNNVTRVAEFDQPEFAWQ